MSQDERQSVLPMVLAARRHFNSGIVVFSSARKVLYVNEAAHDFFRRLNRMENDHTTWAIQGAVPRSVDNLLDEMLKLLRHAVMNRSWKRLEARPLVAADQPVLVQAFGIPNRVDTQRSLIVLTIQDTSHSVPS
jgi:hypothetical protein